MAGGTHIFDMIKRLKENDNLKKKGYFKNREHSKTSPTIQPPDKEAAPELRASIKDNVRESQRRETNKKIELWKRI